MYTNFVPRLDLISPKRVDNITTLTDRIRLVCQAYNMSITTMAATLGVKTSTMHTYIDNDGGREPKHSFFVAFSEKFPNIDLVWLITGVGEMMKKDMSKIEKKLMEAERELSHFKELNELKDQVIVLKGDKTSTLKKVK